MSFFKYAAAFAAFILLHAPAWAICKGNFRMEFGHTVQLDWRTPKNFDCRVHMQFDYVAFYGFSVRQPPRHGQIRMLDKHTFAYVPRKNFTGTDSFIVDVEGGYVSWQTGTATMRSKAGIAVTVAVGL